MKFIYKSYSLYTKDTDQIWCRSAKFLWKSKFCSGSGSGSWFYCGFQYQTYISYIEDTHQISFGPANFFESYCIQSKSPRTARHPDRHPDRQTKIFFCLFCLLRHTKHEHSSKGENFFFTHAIIILSLCTYSVCDEKVKMMQGQVVINFTRQVVTSCVFVCVCELQHHILIHRTSPKIMHLYVYIKRKCFFSYFRTKIFFCRTPCFLILQRTKLNEYYCLIEFGYHFLCDIIWCDISL